MTQVYNRDVLLSVVRKIHAMGITRVSVSSLEGLGIVDHGTGSSWVAILHRNGYLIPSTRVKSHEQSYIFDRALGWGENKTVEGKTEPPTAQ